MTQIPERPGMITRKQLMDRLDVPNVDISVGLCTVKYVSVVGVWFYDIREACDAMKEFYDKRIYDTELIDRGRGRPLYMTRLANYKARRARVEALAEEGI